MTLRTARHEDNAQKPVDGAHLLTVEQMFTRYPDPNRSCISYESKDLSYGEVRSYEGT